MLRWIYGFHRKDKVKSTNIQGQLGVALNDDAIRKHRLRWYHHIQKQTIYSIINIVEIPRVKRDQRLH